MIIVLLGASGSGKSTIENELATHHGFEKIISYTTRPPRDGETNGKDYYFTNNETFREMVEDRLLAEYDEYSQRRLYGTLRIDYAGNTNRVVVLTPNGFKQLKDSCGSDNVFSVLVEASLGTRIRRYVNRCGVNKFSYDDKNEISSRVERDFGMFLGVEKEVDLVIHNNDGEDIPLLAKIIVDECKRKCGDLK